MENRRQANAEMVFKYLAAVVAVLAIRIVPRPPNIEPVMAAALPFGRKLGGLSAAFLAFFGMFLFDFIDGKVGAWTAYTAVAYAVAVYLAGNWLASRKKVGIKHYVGASVAATLFFDVTTMLAIGAEFGTPLPLLVAGQVPFTIAHLLGNAVFAATLSPLIEKHFIERPLFAGTATRAGMMK